jgi:hypothetical protein
LTDKKIYVNFYYEPAGADGIPTSESVTVTATWREWKGGAQTGVIFQRWLFDGRVGTTIYVPNNLPFSYNAILDKEVADMSYLKYGATVDTASLGNTAHMLTDGNGHNWE